MNKSAFILLRFGAASIPFLFSIVVPYLISPSSTSVLFYNLSRLAILSSILKLGMDIYILRRKDLAENSCVVSLMFLIQSLVIGLIMINFGCQLNEVFGAILFSILIIWGALELSLGHRLKSLMPVQFLFYPILLIILVFDTNVNALMLALICSFIIYIPFLSKRTSEVSIKDFKNYFNREYLWIALYSVLSLGITNAPVLLAKNYLDDPLTISIFQTIKFVGISSLISNIYVFLYNPNMQKGAHRIERKESLIIVISVAILVIWFNYLFAQLALFPLLGLIITVSILSFGNIKGFILLHNQTAHYLLISIMLACLSFAGVVALFGIPNLIWAFYSAVIVEAILKIFIFNDSSDSVILSRKKN